MSEKKSPNKLPKDKSANEIKQKAAINIQAEPGSYELHIFIEETRGLENPEHTNETIDPLIKCSAFGEVQSCSHKVKVGTGQTYWGEHFFFLKKIEDIQYFCSNKLKIEVVNFIKIGKDSIVGELSLDLISIYKESNHCLLYTWAGLSNFKQNSDELKGFIKFSVSILGKNDEPITLEKEKVLNRKLSKNMTSKIGKRGLLGANLLLPPQIITKSHQIKITLIRGENLMKLDYLLGSIDAYVIASFGNDSITTEYITNNRNPIWGKIIYLVYSEPTINEYLSLCIMDNDKGKQDDILGTILINKRDIIEEKYKDVRWVNIFGSPPDTDNHFSELMNSNSNLGSYWKGRILVSIEGSKDDKAKHLIENMEEESINLWKTSFLTDYTILVEINQAISLPIDNSDYEIKIRWADKEFLFDRKKSKNNYCKWNLRKDFVISLPYLSSTELPDIMIYLMNGGKIFSYYRFPIEEALDYNLKTKPLSYFKFLPEKSIDPNLRIDLAGILLMRIGVICGDNPEIKKNIYAKWDENSSNILLKRGVLFANIYQARDIAPSDNDGTSDAFISIICNEVEMKTTIIEETLNPVWLERIKIPIIITCRNGINDFQDSQILLKIYDKDSLKVLDSELYSKDDFLGAAFIDINKGIEEKYILLNKFENADPTWLTMKYNEMEGAKLLVSFNIFDEEINEKQMPLLDPLTEEYSLNLKILGLRNLKTSGILPIQKPFIKIDLSGLKALKGQKNKSENNFLTIHSSNGGSNPNIANIIKVDIDLPVDLRLCPSLTCVVYDTVWEGFIQPIIGVFTIDLENLAYLTKRKFQKGLNSPNVIKLMGLNADTEINFIKDDFTIEINDSPKTNQKKSSGDKLLEDDYSNDKYVKKYKTYPPVIDKKGNINEKLIVIPPKYKKDVKKLFLRESEVPDQLSYLGLGYDKREQLASNNLNKHYRYYVNSELEGTDFVTENLFNEYNVKKGKRFVDEDIFEGLLSFDDKSKDVGLFKGILDIYKKENEILSPFLNSEDTPLKLKDETFDSEILSPTNVVIRVYIIDVLNLPPMDNNSLSDPYIQIVLDKQKVNNSDSYLKDVTNAGIFKVFELKGSLPGPSQLILQVWDHDDLKSDDLIGQTLIDIENRFFCKKWRSMNNKPIETRILYHPLSSIARGKIRLWLEIIPYEQIDKIIKWNITPKPPMDFEIRAVIWDCKNVPIRDKEGTSDIYITGRIGDEIFHTDTHFRSSNGFGSFNWRMIWRVKLPLKDNTINFQIWDEDFLTQDDFIAETTLDFSNQSELSYENDCPAKIYGKKNLNIHKSFETVIEKWINKDVKDLPKTKEIFKIELKNSNKEGYIVKNGNSKKPKKSSLSLSFEIVPLEYAMKNPVGSGRNDPNHSPWLPPPLNRVNLIIDTKKYINTILTPNIKAKLICYSILGCLACFLLIFTIAFIASLAANGAL